MYIYIKGEDIPLEAPDAMYDAFFKAMDNYAQKKGDVVIKLASTTVKASEIKRLKKSESVPIQEEDFATLNQSAKNFEETKLSKYLMDGKLTMEKELEFMRDEGVISLKKNKPDGEGKTGSDFQIAVYSDKVREYDHLTNQMALWAQYKGRVMYAENKRLEELRESGGLVGQTI